MSCLKHFPGKGRVEVDAHIDLPTLDVPIATMLSSELRPFREIPGDSIMPSHIYMPQMQANRVPASMSREILIELARNMLGYRGVLVADDLGMGGVSNYFSPEEAAVEGLRNGMDFLTFCHVPEVQKRAKKAVIKAVEQSGELTGRLEESLERVETFRRKATAMKLEPLNVIGTDESLSTMQRISDASITAILEDESLVPLSLEAVTAIYSVRLSRLVQVEDGPLKGVPAVARELAQMSDCPLIDFDGKISVEEAIILADKAPRKGVRIVFTENAHLSAGQREFLMQLSRRPGRTLLIALRNPYDAFIKGVKNSILSYGYETLSQKSLLKVLTGEIKPQGVLPVEIPQEV
jgi:beta-N-acetylhexosaminidase